MTTEDHALLRNYTDRFVRAVMTDGEHLTVKIILLQDEYRDFICDIVATDRSDEYKKPLNSCAFKIASDQVRSFALAEGPDR